MHARRCLVRALALVLPAFLVLALGMPTGQALAASTRGESDVTSSSDASLSTPYALVEDRDVTDRQAQPEDRYAVAGGCYTIEAVGQGFVMRQGTDLVLTTAAAQAEPFHFQATRLGEYLIATNEGPDTRWDDANWDVRGFLAAEPIVPEPALRGSGIPGQGLLPNAPRPPQPTTGAVTVAAEPSERAEWRLIAAGDDPERRIPGEGVGQGQGQGNRQRYLVTSATSDSGLTVVGGRLVVGAAGDAAELTLRHVASGASNGVDCARWPEIDTNTSGPPAPTGNGPAGEALGFFEAHVHGMAFEFLGGELRCGRPWHPYGVEYALGDCAEDGNVYNGALEVPLGGAPATDPVLAYDPVGWPTFEYWPRNRTLTHEQFYYRWLERAHHGGLRLVTNLLVDNTALCQLFPFKKNSCNEMDSVRLQAQRLFELQDYIDAQSGGPGEGWLRIVTSPAQAREVINAGRLAVVLGIEISALFDCSEFLDVPNCSAEQIDDRLDEVFAMGVRQLQLVNKFDNALAGVTGDPGQTGVVVNSGNRQVTGHWWDMQTCVEDAAHGHGLEGEERDKTQLNVRDEVTNDERDVLTGTVIDLFAPTRGFVAPAYPKGPHCNTRGLTDLGEHVIRGMIERGFIFDPDHMSAAAQREALDLIELDIIPAEIAAAEAEADGRPVILPALMSSHSWGNDVIYQRIYALSGVVAPYANAADGYVRDWEQRRRWADHLAPEGTLFGMGYGADTNGLGGQPSARQGALTPTDYSQPFAAPIGGVLINQQVSGLQTFDVNTQGVSHYGIFADWYHEVALAADQRYPDLGGGKAIIDDMLRGPETYLQLWERAVYGGASCVDDQSGLQVEDLHALLGANVEGFLTAIGQPVSRDGAAYIYCVENASGEREVVEVLFDAEGAASAVQPGTVSSWLTVDRIGAVLDHSHAPEGLPLSDDSGGGSSLVLLLGMGALAFRLQPLRRPRAEYLAVAAPVLAVLAFTLP